jgi:7,8-dihydro-6-hydroxymethylpterin-pyrophosphokinase
MGMFTSLVEADKPKLFAKDQATHDKLVAEAAVYGSAPIGSGKNRMYRNYRLACGHEQEVATSNMRTGSFSCQTCQDTKLIEEAAVYGSDPIGCGKNAQYRNYRLPCGHQQEVQTGDMRVGVFACQTCFENKLIDEAAIYGSEPIGAGKNADYRNYRLPCGHQQEVITGKMRIGSFRCQICLDAKIIDEAAVWDSEPVGDGKNCNYRNYRLPCGHQQEVQVANMRIGRFRCQICLDAKIIDEAAVWDSEPVGDGKNCQYRNYRLPCGHEQEVQVGHMRIGVFRCQTCEDTWITKPSNVYVHIISLQGETFVKVGRAQNVENRVNQYGLPLEAVVQTVLEAPTKTGKDANDIERKVLKKFKPYRVKNIGHIMTKSGATECFDVSKLSEILDSTKFLAEVK